MAEFRDNNPQPLLLELRDAEYAALPSDAERVLDGISLSIHEEEVVAILGPSGSGKSTLARLAAGIARPTAGSVAYRGEPLLGPDPRIGLVFQTAALFPWLTVQDNIALGLERLNLDDKSRAELVAWAVDRVGVDGYEDVYPRELSAGMKQRVGLARALCGQPELLVLDEPFSALDVLTAETLRNELLNLWQNTEVNPRAILMVTHDIQEAVFLANRIIILSGRPTKVRAVVNNPLAYPRLYQSQEFQDKVSQIHDIITKDIMPDEAPALGAARYSQRLAPLPKAELNQVLGLLEALDDNKGRLDVFDFAASTGRDYASVIMVCNAAEMLGLVRTPRDQVEITELGRQVLRMDVNGRKHTFNLRLQGLRFFSHILDMIHRSPEHRLSKDVLLEEFALLFPSEAPAQLFSTLVGWGRYAELLAYSARKGTLTIDRLAQGAAPEPLPAPPVPEEVAEDGPEEPPSLDEEPRG